MPKRCESKEGTAVRPSGLQVCVVTLCVWEGVKGHSYSREGPNPTNKQVAVRQPIRVSLTEKSFCEGKKQKMTKSDSTPAGQIEAELSQRRSGRSCGGWSRCDWQGRRSMTPPGFQEGTERKHKDGGVYLKPHVESVHIRNALCVEAPAAGSLQQMWRDFLGSAASVPRRQSAGPEVSQ